MPRELKNLVLEEVSAVDVPANPGARVVLLKRNSGRMKINEFLSGLAKAAGLSDQDAKQLVEKTLKEDDGMPQGSEDITKMQAQIARLEKRDAVHTAIAKAADPAALDAVAADVANATELNDADKAEFTAAVKARQETMKAADSAKRYADFAKSLPEVIAKAFNGMTDADKDAFMKSYTAPKADDPIAKAMTDLTKRNEVLEKQVAELTKATETAALKEQFKDLADVVKLDDFVETYRTVKAASPAQADALVEQLRATAKRAETAGLFKTIGRDGNGAGDTAEAKLEKAAEALIKADPNLTREAAFAKAVQDNPALYAAYNSEKKGA